MDKKKKPFKETKVGQFLSNKAPKILDAVGNLLPDQGVIGIVKRIISTQADILSPEDKAEALNLIREYEIEVFGMEIQDRVSARTREVEMAKTGKTDHLMYVSGYVALSAFLIMVVAVIWKPDAVRDNPLFHQLMGIIEGVALTVFGYYFGSSKGSSEKTRLLKQ
jgi:sulfite reductase beta subunit-like hemoprotein